MGNLWNYYGQPNDPQIILDSAASDIESQEPSDPRRSGHTTVSGKK